MALSIPEAFESFLAADTVAAVERSFGELLEASGTSDLRGAGIQLFAALKEKVCPKLKFIQKKLFTELENHQKRSASVLNSLRSAGSAPPPSMALVCGAGPVGLRVALEAQMLGFQVTVVEKRSDFSRANILTFWQETMDDLLSLAARTYCPNIVTAGDVRHLGTREIQLVLLKDFLLFGGEIRYGHEIVGLVPPAKSGGKWQGRFCPHVKGGHSSQAGAAAAADSADGALDFKQAKDMGELEKGGNKSVYYERSEVDASFVAGEAGEDAAELRVSFDAYFIAQGSWSDSSKKLGFTKVVTQRKQTIGFVVNMKYDKENATERAQKSFLKHMLSPDWPLKNCPIAAEFVEYLKGETHFYAMVCMLTNPANTPERRAQFEEMEAAGNLTPEALAAMRLSLDQMGLLEMGVVKEMRPKSALLAPDNIDVEKMREMARTIATDCGLPDTAEFFSSNPVQLFDFSALAKCEEPARILRGDGAVLAGTEENAASASGVAHSAVVLPVGDALQDPLWTSGLGVNRGFHGGLNAVWAATVAREKGLALAMTELSASWKKMQEMQWGDGRLAGGGSGSSGVKAGAEWTADPRSRIPFKK